MVFTSKKHSTQSEGNLIIQFAKWPVPGHVKTRLAQSIGLDAALHVHQKLLASVLTSLIDAKNGKIELWFDQAPVKTCALDNKVAELLKRHNIAVLTQQGENLGERMGHAILSGLATAKRVVIVGSDCPTIDQAYLKGAFYALESNDLVFGPAEDGGFVLVGAKRFESPVFEGVAWGSPKVLSQVMARAEQASLSVGLLDLTWDVDELSDYERWQRIIAENT